VFAVKELAGEVDDQWRYTCVFTAQAVCDALRLSLLVAGRWSTAHKALSRWTKSACESMLGLSVTSLL